MGFGSTAKKIQKLADVAEKTYSRIDDLREQLTELRGTVEDTGQRVERLESELDEQRALLEAVAAEHDIDVDAVTEEAVGEDGEGASASTDENGETPSGDGRQARQADGSDRTTGE